jgi:GT2 family glycosyltransferase
MQSLISLSPHVGLAAGGLTRRPLPAESTTPRLIDVPESSALLRQSWPSHSRPAANQGRLPVPELSIIIPVVGQQQDFENTLISVLENRPHDCEIIVVCDERYDDPYALGDEVTFVEARREAGLVERLALGVGESRAELVHLLGDGSRVTAGWTTAALAHFRRPRVATVIPIVVDQRRPSRSVAAGAELTAGGRRRLHRRLPRRAKSAHETTLAAPLVAAFLRKSAYQLVGGLDATVGDALADVDLGARLRHAGYLSVIEPESRLSHDGPLSSTVPAESQGRAESLGRQQERLFWRNAPTFGWGRALRRHPLAVAWRLLQRPLPWHVAEQLGGRVAALADLRDFREHYRKLAGIRGLANVMGEPESASESVSHDASDSLPADERQRDVFSMQTALAMETHRRSNRRPLSGRQQRSRAA